MTHIPTYNGVSDNRRAPAKEHININFESLKESLKPKLKENARRQTFSEEFARTFVVV